MVSFLLAVVMEAKIMIKKLTREHTTRGAVTLQNSLIRILRLLSIAHPQVELLIKQEAVKNPPVPKQLRGSDTVLGFQPPPSLPLH